MRSHAGSLSPCSALVWALIAGSVAAQRDDAWISDLAFPPGASIQSGQIAIDPLLDEFVLLRNNGQTLTWNGTAFVVRGTVATPLVGAAIATSSVPGYTGVVAFGGRNPSGAALAQTLLYGNGLWARRFPANLPPARAQAAMATFGIQPLLFGGVDANGNELNDTWILTSLGTDGRWLEVLCSTQPSPRHGAAMCSDGNGGLLLFGGHDGTRLCNDTWRFGNFDWSQVSTSVSPPPSTGPMSFDRDRREVIHVDPVSGATFRFDPDGDDWQAIVPPTLSTPFAATTTGGPCYMAYDQHLREHVFLDAAAGLSIYRVADATPFLRQPIGCAPHLGLTLAAGSPRLGGSYLLRVDGVIPGAPTWLGASARRLAVPGIMPASQCLVFLFDWLLLIPSVGANDRTAWFSLSVPNQVNLIGFEVDHQAIDLWTQGTTDDVVARITRS